MSEESVENFNFESCTNVPQQDESWTSSTSSASDNEIIEENVADKTKSKAAKHVYNFFNVVTSTPKGVKFPPLLDNDKEEDHDISIFADDDVQYTEEEKAEMWEMNYREAAIYLEEGLHNDKFDTHPTTPEALRAYLITRKMWFYLFDLFASVMIMALIFVEGPGTPIFEIPLRIHCSVEICLLFMVMVELTIKFQWMGWRHFIRSGRCMLKLIIVTLLMVEACVIIVRQERHIRITRIFRVVLLIDTRLCREIRRYILQMIQCVPTIIDMLLLPIFFMLIFAILGVYLFLPQNDPYFTNMENSFIHLFVLMTTSNYPDVMMHAYVQSYVNVAFFITFLIIELYIMMNLILAVLYDVFTKFTKDKLRRLLLHEREACCRAFKLLTTKKYPHSIPFKHYLGMMEHYKHRMTRRTMYLCFKALNVRSNGLLTLEEFYEVNSITRMFWSRVAVRKLWSDNFCYPCNRFFKKLHMLVASKFFSWFISFVILANFGWILAEVIIMPNDHSEVSWYTMVFVAIYVIEAILKILGLGPKEYFTAGWNIFDFIVTVAGLVGLIIKLVLDQSFLFIVILRPFRLLRLFKMKARYRDVMGTIFLLLPQLIIVCCTMICLYYIFAIIGMECFSNIEMRNCCVNSSVESYYRYDPNSTNAGYYWANNFETVLTSGVTLFELTVVNNWYVIMDAYAIMATGWSRIYFIIFYILILIVINVVIASIIEAFVFRIHYSRYTSETSSEDMSVLSEPAFSSISTTVHLNKDEMKMCKYRFVPLSADFIKPMVPGSGADVEGRLTCYRGVRVAKRRDYTIQMCKDEVQSWIEEGEKHRRATSAIAVWTRKMSHV